MTKCIAYERASGSREAWRACRRRAAHSSVFCGRHGDAVDGAVLGMLVSGYGLGEDLGSARRTVNRGARGSRSSMAAKLSGPGANQLHG